MKKLKLDLSPGADGAGNQSSIELSTPMPDNDTYEAADMSQSFPEPFRAVVLNRAVLEFGFRISELIRIPGFELRISPTGQGSEFVAT